MSFSLRSLLVAFVVVASALGTFGPCGLVVGLATVACVAVFWSVRDTASQCACALFVAGLVFVTLSLPAVELAKEAARHAWCANNLKQVSLALLQYEQQYGTLPPAYVPGPDGKPWHSWRVLLLPFLEQDALYKAYRFDEPWDGPNNRKLAASIPSVYVCPLSDAKRTRSGATTYFAVVGPETAWPGAKGQRLAEIRDGPGRTILVMEAASVGISWMEPRDLDFKQIAAQSEPDPSVVGAVAHPDNPGLFHTSEGGSIHVAFADGRIEAIPWGVSGKVMAPLLTASAGDAADVAPIPPLHHERLNWPRILSLAAFVLSALLLVWTTRPGRRASSLARHSGAPHDTIGPPPDAAPPEIPP